MGAGAETCGAGCEPDTASRTGLEAQDGAAAQPASQPGAAAPADLAAAALAAAQAAAAAPPIFCHAVPHIPQCYNWDCGLACVLMVLRALGLRQYHMGALLELCPTRSIWTIDLAHLLAACGAQVQLLTVTLGANQEYSSEHFYAATMQDDSARVERLFRTAAASGIAVAQRSVPLSVLRSLLLSGRCLVVALVDKATLCSATATTRSGGSMGSAWSPGGLRRSGRLAGEPRACGDSAASDGAIGKAHDQGTGAAAEGGSSRAADSGGAAAREARAGGAAVAAAAAAGQRDAPAGQAEAAAAAAGAAVGRLAAAAAAAAGPSEAPGPPDDSSMVVAAAAVAGGYLGHYIVLCGYDARSDEFELRDPASDRPRLWVPAARLEAARKAFGTDEDLLVVSTGTTAGSGTPAAPAAEQQVARQPAAAQQQRP